MKSLSSTAEHPATLSGREPPQAWSPVSRLLASTLPLLLAVASGIAVAWLPLNMGLVVVALSVVGVVTVAAAARAHRPTVDAGAAGWDRTTVVVSVTLAALATDVVVFGPRELVYAITAVIAGVVVTRPRSGRLLMVDVPLLVLLVWGLAGSLIGRLFLGQPDNALAFFAPAVAALIHVWAPLPLGHAWQARRLTSVLLAVCTAYAVISYLVLVQGWSGLPSDDFKHTHVYFVAMGLVAAWLLRRWIVLTVLVALSIPAFLAYPGLTFVLVLGGASGAVLATARRVGPMILAVGAALAGLFFTLGSASITALRIDYFRQVGKIDNTGTRETLLRTGLDRFWKSPVVGDSFTRDITVPSNVTGSIDRVPVHNDFLQMAISGGGIAGLLFVIWSIAAMAMAVLLVRNLRAAGRHDHAALALVATVGLIAMFVTALFNPIMIDARNSTVLALLYTMLASLALQHQRAAKARP